jgi:hypothetical protein
MYYIVTQAPQVILSTDKANSPTLDPEVVHQGEAGCDR